MLKSEKQLLPTLQRIINTIGKSRNFQAVTFVCVQHLLFSTIDLIKSLIILGARVENIHVMGKIYSSCPEVEKYFINIGVNFYSSTLPKKPGVFNRYFYYDIVEMWSKILKKLQYIQCDTIIILDDGSKCINNIPKVLLNSYKICAIEQTSFGIRNIKKNFFIPTIDVAFSAAKQFLESHMIAKAVIKKIDFLLSGHIQYNICGVVGLGVIGKAVVEKLLSIGCRVVVYDKYRIESNNLFKKIMIMNDINSLFQKSDYIFGCTGEDITISLDFNFLEGEKKLISCSSQDIEFNSLLQKIPYRSLNFTVLDNLKYSINKVRFNFLRGGYPINLDNSGTSVPEEDIQLTRGLLLGGIIQGSLFVEQIKSSDSTNRYMLNPKIQKLVVKELVTQNRENDYNKNVIRNLLNESWIKNHSKGIYIVTKF